MEKILVKIRSFKYLILVPYTILLIAMVVFRLYYGSLIYDTGVIYWMFFFYILLLKISGILSSKLCFLFGLISFGLSALGVILGSGLGETLARISLLFWVLGILFTWFETLKNHKDDQAHDD